MPAAQSELGVGAGAGAGAGYRGKFALRNAKPNNGSRSARATESENINPNSDMGGKRSPRLGPCVAANTNNGRPLSSRRPGGCIFGADITNKFNVSDITTGRADKLKPLKQQFPDITNKLNPLPQTQVLELDKALNPPPQTQVLKTGETVNAQDVEEYIADISNQLFVEELTSLPRADYMDTQAHLAPKMRTILVDWLIEVHMKYKLRSETLHLAINLIDRYLSKVPVARNKLQLVGVVAMFIASKFEEISPPELHDWVYITDKAYTKNEVLMMECTMLTTLSFQIMVPTVAHFLPGLQKGNGCNNVHSKLVQYILELGLLDIRMLQYTPSHAVAAALLLSNEFLALARPVWPQNMIQSSHHTEATLRPCANLLRELVESDRNIVAGSQLQAVHKKYCLKENEFVATMKLF